MNVKNFQSLRPSPWRFSIAATSSSTTATGRCSTRPELAKKCFEKYRPPLTIRTASTKARKTSWGRSPVRKVNSVRKRTIQVTSSRVISWPTGFKILQPRGKKIYSKLSNFQMKHFLNISCSCCWPRRKFYRDESNMLNCNWANLYHNVFNSI